MDRHLDRYDIIGGGIAGLTTALSLAKYGLASTVHERAASFDEVGAGIQLSPNAMRVLSELGLQEALEGTAVAPARIVLHDGRTSGVLAELPLADAARTTDDAPYLVIHRADLQSALVEACEADRNITVERGSHRPKDVNAPCVLAADGVHSVWREAVRGPSKARYTGHVSWRTTHPVTSPEPQPITRVWFGPQAHLVDYPIRSGRERNLVAIARRASPPADDYSVSSDLLSAFRAWHPALLARLAEQESWTPWPLNGVDPDAAWVTDKVALIGDAAHAMLPFLAQGGAMAIEDAWVLATKLATYADHAEAFKAYEAARKPRVSRVWKEAAKNGRIYHMNGPLALARNMALKLQPGSALLARYDWVYDWVPPASPSASSAISSSAP